MTLLQLPQPMVSYIKLTEVYGDSAYLYNTHKCNGIYKSQIHWKTIKSV
jgi:hypothetical protein